MNTADLKRLITVEHNSYGHSLLAATGYADSASNGGRLMRHALTGGPLTAVRRLTRLLRIMRIVTRVITAERDRHAYALGALWSQRAAADKAGVSFSTMQRWMEAGRPNGNGAADAATNSNSNSGE